MNDVPTKPAAGAAELFDCRVAFAETLIALAEPRARRCRRSSSRRPC